MPPKPPSLDISPPLLNSANPWATTLDDLISLYACKSTGAVTTRTSLIEGFDHDPQTHQYVFFDSLTHTSATHSDSSSGVSRTANTSLNSLGYSPLHLGIYLEAISAIAKQKDAYSIPRKWFIVSVTGSAEAVAQSYDRVLEHAKSLPDSFPLAMEINLSCPNIPGRPPPAYSGPGLATHLAALAEAIRRGEGQGQGGRIPVGLKTPPYTHAGQYDILIDALLKSACDNAGASPLSFLTATNTLGSCLVLEDGAAALPGSGMGGLGGAALHPLALGNVATLRRRLDEWPGELGHVQIIGVGGVGDAEGYRRMRRVGAGAVGVGTALGLKGVEVFEEIEKGLGGEWEV